jgi:hypothetical protein
LTRLVGGGSRSRSGGPKQCRLRKQALPRPSVPGTPPGTWRAARRRSGGARPAPSAPTRRVKGRPGGPSEDTSAASPAATLEAPDVITAHTSRSPAPRRGLRAQGAGDDVRAGWRGTAAGHPDPTGTCVPRHTTSCRPGRRTPVSRRAPAAAREPPAAPPRPGRRRRAAPVGSRHSARPPAGRSPPRPAPGRRSRRRDRRPRSTPR